MRDGGSLRILPDACSDIVWLAGVGAIVAGPDMATAGAPDRAVQAAALRLLHASQRVDRLAADLGLSERQLRRRCRAAAGYGPKPLQRVLRLRRFLHGDRADLGRAALDAGYADHLTRECRRRTGLSPARLG